MYKTIRQGENSLQYTILPQQDEGRSGPVVVGHRNNGGNPRQSAGSRKKSILAYIGLFFVCAIITFAILIPLMVTTDLMPTPSAWFYRNQKVRDFRSPVNVKLSVDARQESHIIKGTPLRTTLTMTTTATPMTTSTTTATSTTTETSVTRPAEHTDLLTVTEFQNLYKSDESMEQSGMNRMDLLQEEFIAPTTTTTAVNLFLSRARQRMTTTTTTGTLTSTIRPSSTPQLLQRNYPKHFSLQKHEKAATTFDIVQQAPQAPPPQPDSRTIRVVTNDDEMSTVHQNWLQSHWSYVDPYLQWRVSGE